MANNTITVNDRSGQPVTLDTQGTPVPAAGTLPAPGYGPMGWLSHIWVALTSRFPAALANGRLDVNVGSSATLPVSVSALPLPTGATQDSTLTGGTQKSIARGAAKGTTAAADVTVTSVNADHNALDVNIAAGSVTATPGALAVTYTPASGTITTGGTAQTALAANASRKALFIKNPDNATEDLWIRFTGTATTSLANSIPLAPGDAWDERGNGVTTQAVSVVAATTGHAFIMLEG